MGGKGGGDGSGQQQFKPPGQAATGQDPFAGGQSRSQQQPQQRSMPAMPAFPQGRTGGDTRIGADKLTNLYAPTAKTPPAAPMPARIGVRAERRAYNPTLAIGPAEEKRLQQNIDTRRGYGPTFAISGGEIDSGSLLGSDIDDEAGFGGYGLGL